MHHNEQGPLNQEGKMDEIMEIIDKINAASLRMEETALKYLVILEELEALEQEVANNGS
jgi:hypothetical protein